MNEGKDIGQSQKSKSRRFNIVWTIIGLLVYIATVESSETIILKTVIEPNPELSQLLDNLEKGTQVSLPDEQKQRLRGMVFKDPLFIGVGVSAILIIPLLIGACVGVFSKGIKESMTALGVGAIFIAIAESGMAEILIVTLPLNVGLGAAGGWLGMKLFKTKQ